MKGNTLLSAARRKLRAAGFVGTALALAVTSLAWACTITSGFLVITPLVLEDPVINRGDNVRLTGRSISLANQNGPFDFVVYKPAAGDTTTLRPFQDAVDEDGDGPSVPPEMIVDGSTTNDDVQGHACMTGGEVIGNEIPLDSGVYASTTWTVDVPGTGAAVVWICVMDEATPRGEFTSAPTPLVVFPNGT